MFDPNAINGEESGIFGLPYRPEESRIVLFPVPWEATTSYGKGTAEGPAAILRASRQVDLFDRELGSFHAAGIAMLPEPDEVRGWSERARALLGSDGGVEELNALGGKVNDVVEARTREILGREKIPGILGGEHSVSFGSIKACAAHAPGLGVLHIDAHCDLRRKYEELEHSHASVMQNVVRGIPGVGKLVQVGIRDFCEEEKEFMDAHAGKISVFFDEDMAGEVFRGKTWNDVCAAVVESLPRDVYISFDIDGLDPSLCPHTGTPVPGGLSFNQAQFLIKTLVKSGRRIVGFDLVEVAPGGEGEWDANVGASLLFVLCGWALKSQEQK